MAGNPYPPGTEEWFQYQAGSADGKAAGERVLELAYGRFAEVRRLRAERDALLAALTRIHNPSMSADEFYQAMRESRVLLRAIANKEPL